MPRIFRLLSLVSMFTLAAALVASAVPPEGSKGDKKTKAPAKGSPEEALVQVQVEKGLTVKVWAAEPLLANPVSFAFDEKGRAFVCETTRFGKGVPDTRSHMYWLDDDLANRSTADLLKMYQRTYPPDRPGDKPHEPYAGFEKYADQLRVVWDEAGTGAADQSRVFSGGYNRPQDGLAAGVLARKGDVYFANIPDLYKLRDTNGDGAADVKTSLFTGFGPTAQFLGHDLHGLRMGPDGKLYFSIGDRGFNVTTKEGKQLLYPNTGAVLRCEPDGSHLEVVHYGLRNPQELAFDDFGNLFTFDNNSDSGDRARWVYVVEGGDSGWRGGYQYGTAYHLSGTPQANRGPWNSEKIWHVPGKDGEPPAYVVPPLLHFGNGPAGITHYPGVGLNDKYKDHFFACDFTSNANNSVIWSVAVKAKGAGFEVQKPEPFVRGMVPTDCEFGPDGAFYWSDWVGGWSPPGKGRIFRLTDPEAMKNPAVAEAKQLLADGLGKKTADELAKLLEHPHQQVRLEAQYELVNLKADARLTKVANESQNRVARLHAVWGLGMLLRSHKEFLPTLAALAGDTDSEVRAQALKVVGGLRYLPAESRSWLADRLADSEPRVRFFAAIAFGKISYPRQSNRPFEELARYTPLLDLLKSNNDTDAYLRHAAVVGLAELSQNPADLWNVWAEVKEKYDTPAVRLGLLLAFRRLQSGKVADFLTDSDPRLVAEAARAIHDERIDLVMPKLAALTDKPSQPDAVAFRALSANFKLGTADAAARVAKFAARTAEAEHARVFALKLLADWSSPPRRDHITGLTVKLPPQPETLAADALRPVVAGVFGGSEKVRAEAAHVATKLGIREVGPLLVAVVKDAAAAPADRADALLALATVGDGQLAQVVKLARESAEPKLRAAGLTVQAKSDPEAILRSLPALLQAKETSLAEKQAAFAVLAGLKESEAADKLLEQWVTAAAAGDVPGDLVLDVVDAAETRTKTPKLTLHAPLPKRLAAWRAAKDLAADNLAPWAESLDGGDAAKGRNLFLNNSAVYCLRCHKLDGQGGDVGPQLNGIAAQPGKDRRYLLEAVVLPSAQIAKGFETAVLSLADGRVVSGVVKEDTKKQLKIVTPENKELVIPTDDIESRRTGPSAMPDDLHKKLSRRELRDLVEFLASLKDPEPKGGP